MVRFTIGVLSLCFCFSICPSSGGAEGLLVTLKEQEEISQRIIDLIIANRSSIRTWQGQAIVMSRMFDDGIENAGPSREIRYEVDFAYDVVSGNKAWENRILAGSRAHAKQNAFVLDEIHHYLTTGHPNDVGDTLRQLHIFHGSAALVLQFNPTESSLPFPQDVIETMFSMTILKPFLAMKREWDFSEKEIEEYRQEVLANGFKGYSFRLDGNVLTREMAISGHLREVFVVNLDQGGSITTYRQLSGPAFMGFKADRLLRGWDATYQKVNHVWIPKKTRHTQTFDDGSLNVEEIEWTDQKINEKIPDERFTLKGIGAFQGIEVIDYSPHSLGRLFRLSLCLGTLRTAVRHNILDTLDIFAAPSWLGSNNLSRCRRSSNRHHRTVLLLALAQIVHLEKSNHCRCLSRTHAAHENHMDHCLPDLAAHCPCVLRGSILPQGT